MPRSSFCPFLCDSPTFDTFRLTRMKRMYFTKSAVRCLHPFLYPEACIMMDHKLFFLLNCFSFVCVLALNFHYFVSMMPVWVLWWDVFVFFLLSPKDPPLPQVVREIHPVSVIICFSCLCCPCTKRLLYDLLHVYLSLLVGVPLALPSLLVLFAFENFHFFSFCWLLLVGSDETLLSIIMMNIITTTANVFIVDISNLHATGRLNVSACDPHGGVLWYCVWWIVSLLWPLLVKTGKANNSAPFR